MQQEETDSIEEQAKEEAYFRWERAGRPILPKEYQDRMYFEALGAIQASRLRRQGIRNKVLYFPFISVPASSWFTRILLYWDEVATIVPRECSDDPDTLGPHTTSLIKEGLLTQISPGSYIADIPDFDTAFISYLNRLGPILEQRRKSFLNRGKSFSIHIEKMERMSDYLIKSGLARQSGYSWFDVESITALDFMNYLAAVLGRHPQLQFAPVTDTPSYLYDFLAASDSGVAVEKKLAPLRYDVLEDLLPAPSSPLPASEIRGFKRKHGPLLAGFRNAVERELVAIADIKDPVLREHRLALFKEQSAEEIRHITVSMNEWGWADLVFGKLCAIAAAIPGVPWLVGLAAAVYQAFRGSNTMNDKSPLLYAAYAQQVLLRAQE